MANKEKLYHYQFQDEQEINDSVGGGSEGLGDGTPMSQYNSRGGGAARSVVNRIGVYCA